MHHHASCVLEVKGRRHLTLLIVQLQSRFMQMIRQAGLKVSHWVRCSAASKVPVPPQRHPCELFWHFTDPLLRKNSVYFGTWCSLCFIMSSCLELSWKVIVHHCSSGR